MRTAFAIILASALMSAGPAAAFNMHVPKTVAAAAISPDHQAVLRLSTPEAAGETPAGADRVDLFRVLVRVAVRLSGLGGATA